MTASLSAASLCLIRGDRCLFKDLEFSLQSGEILVIEGPNGSGKTSLLRGLAGLLGFETGEITWNGQSTDRNQQEFRADLAWFAHRVGFKGDLTLTENLDFESGLRGLRADRRGQVLAELGLSAIVDLPFRSLSAGQQRRAALARVLLSTARLWVMDEPFTNLDKEGQSLVGKLIGQHLSEGGLCIVATHQSLEIGAETKRLVLG